MKKTVNVVITYVSKAYLVLDRPSRTDGRTDPNVENLVYINLVFNEKNSCLSLFLHLKSKFSFIVYILLLVPNFEKSLKDI